MPTVDDYFAKFPALERKLLEQCRATILAVAPDAEQMVKYGLAAFMQGGTYIVYLAGWKTHIAVYPIPDGSEAFLKAIEPWRDEKSTLRFPLDRPIPYQVIDRLVRARLQELQAKAPASLA
jgi:uncharacterized protein YdhG (YjbR/CyaY superfamily)